MRPSIRQLEYAVALGEALHFGRAARRCAVTQPALSAQIKELEELLGVQLFERGRRGVLVTAVGERVLAQAREALAAIDGVLDAAEGGRAPLSGKLTLGVIPTVAPYLLPAVLPAVRAARPELELILREERTDELLARLRGGQLDVALLALPVDERELRSLPLYEEPFVLAAPPEHPLARARGRSLRQDSLAGHSVVLLEDGHCFRDQALAVCERAGSTEAGDLRATSLCTLVQMVAGGLGATLLPASAVPVEVHAGSGLAVKTFRPPVPSRTIGLVWRRASARAEAFEELGARIVEALPRLDLAPLRPARPAA